MLTFTKQKKVTIVLLALSLSLMLLAESAFAKRARKKGGNPNRGNMKSQQITGKTRGHRGHKSWNSGRAHNKSVGFAKQRRKFRNSGLRGRSNSERTIESGFRRSREHKVETNRSTIRTPKTNSGRRKHTRGSFDAGKHIRPNFGHRKQTRDKFSHREQTQDNFSHRQDSRGSFRFGTHRGHRGDRTRRHHRSGHRRHHRFGHHRSRIYSRIVWPRHRRIIYYNYGPYFAFRYFYPFHHRKYIFVSLGGYWPITYRYVRYYRYGYHPYYWYGAYPDLYEVEGDTYNYYTYNYYDDSSAEVPQPLEDVDENTFADVREKLAAQAAEEPDAETLADQHFDDAVKAFEKGDYDTAAYELAEAVKLEPDDIVLPFAYIQALFAKGQYSEAVEVLREAVANLPPDEEGLFFPRGLYANDNLLFEQINRLTEEAELYPSDADLQLLLGYQLLGVSKFDMAQEPLQRAQLNPENADTATKLLDLLEKIKTGNIENTER
jgi:TolA-binding protein